MCSDNIAVDVRSVCKCYDIYASPRDRLKQLVLPSAIGAINEAISAFAPGKRIDVPQFYREFWALRDVSFQVKRGEALGIIGRNGSGKSTLLQILAGILQPTSGSVHVSGRVAALLELGSGFNPEFSGRDNVFINGSILGLSNAEIEKRYNKIVEFADIGRFIDEPVKTYSSGMFVRLAFAVQANIDADVIIIDEALAVGDVFFRQKCYKRLRELRQSGAAILLVSHSMPEVEQYCERALLLDAGTCLLIGSAPAAAKQFYLLSQDNVTSVSDNELPCVDSLGSGTVSSDRKRPPEEAFVSLKGSQEVSNGIAHCMGVALCDISGNPCSSFKQGDNVVIYYEFVVAKPIGIPICGLVMADQRGVFVFGKNSWQYDADFTSTANPGQRVKCWQTITLDIAPGEYTFEVGLAAVTPELWSRRSDVPHAEFSVRHVRICHVTGLGPLRVSFAVRGGVPILTHHGIANLPSSMQLNVVQDAHSQHLPEPTFLKAVRPRSKWETHPTVFHVTHWKAGSQWIYKILHQIDSNRIVAPQVDEKQFLSVPLVDGALYPTVYVTKEQFDSVSLPKAYKHFLVIRDLRDTLVSGYHSIRYSHKLIDERLVNWRRKLEFLSLEDGLLLMLNEWLPASARIQESWVESGIKVVHYEDLLSRDTEIFEELLIDYCKLDISTVSLREIVESNRFERVTGGRKPGQVDLMAHERKGISGDWKNYFTPRICNVFKCRYAGLLHATGYESNVDW